MTNITQIKNLAMKQQEEERQENTPRNRPRTAEEAINSGGRIPNTSQGADYKYGTNEGSQGQSGNRPRNSGVQDNNEGEQKPKKAGILRRIFDVDFKITKDNAPKFLPLILYMACWAILYIANHHYGEKTLLQIDHVNKEMKDLKADYYTSNAELSNKSIQSKVLEMVDTIGLKELRKPPQRLKLIKENEH